jgi:hypothetical protein
MARVRFTSHLKAFFPTLEAGEVAATSVRGLIDELERRYPGLASYLVDEAGRLRRHVNLFIGEEPIADRERLTDRLTSESSVFIAQALSGG